MIDIVPSLIRHLDELPEALAHGDACPSNLLHVDDGIVAIDWSYASNSSIGSDLGQLLAGRFVDGSADPDGSPRSRKPFRRVRRWARRRGAAVDEDAIEYAFITHLLVARRVRRRGQGCRRCARARLQPVLRSLASPSIGR